MENNIDATEILINELLKYYTDIFEKEKNIKDVSRGLKIYHIGYANRKKEFVKKYLLEEFDITKILNDSSTNIFSSLSKRNIEIIKTRFGIYNNGELQTLEQISKLYNIKPGSVRTIIDKFKHQLKKYIEEKIEKICIRKDGYEIRTITNLKEKLNLTHLLLDKIGYGIDLDGLLNLPIQDADFKIKYFGFGEEYALEKLVYLVHSYGLKFYSELNTEEEIKIQNEILDEIWLTGLEKYIEKNNLQKYKITRIDELLLEAGYSKLNARNYKNVIGLTTIEELLKMSEDELTYKFGNIYQTIIQLLHKSGYKFDFEKDEKIQLLKKERNKLTEMKENYEYGKTK